MTRKLLLAGVAAVALATGASAETFIVQSSDGYMNLRDGPGVGHNIIGTVRNGTRVVTSQCAPRDDAPGPDWCFVHLRNADGWISMAGLVSPAGAVPAGPVSWPATPRPFYLTCDAPRMEGGGPDPDPVIRVDVSYHDGLWAVQHTTVRSNIYNREQQYAMVDQSNGSNGAQWAGTRVKNGNQYSMVGSIRWAAQYGRWAYGETLYANSKLDMRSGALCTEVSGVQPAPYEVPSVAVPVTPMLIVPGNRDIGIAEQPAAPVQQHNPGPVQQTGPTQQNGPIIVPPSNNTNNFTIIIPDRAAPKVKAEDDEVPQK